MNPHRLRLPAITLCILLAGACGGTADPASEDSPTGGPTVQSPAGTDPPAGGAAWPFGDEPEAASELEETPPDPAMEPGDGVELAEIAAGDVSDEVAGDEPIDELDPCSLITPAEWAGWRGVDVGTVEQVELEDGEACGYLDAADTVRLAVAVFDASGGSWLPDDVDAETLHIDGRTARWVIGHPVEVSSVLVVDLDGAELVLEMSTRDGTDNQLLQAGAVELADIAVGRWSS